MRGCCPATAGDAGVAVCGAAGVAVQILVICEEFSGQILQGLKGVSNTIRLISVFQNHWQSVSSFKVQVVYDVETSSGHSVTCTCVS